MVEQVEKQRNFTKRLALEKFLFEIENKIASFVSKLMGKSLDIYNDSFTEEISEEEISEIVRHLVFDSGKLYPESYSEDQILRDIIAKKKCNVSYADHMVKSMKVLGLTFCGEEGEASEAYHLIKFGIMRDYITEIEAESFFENRKKTNKEEKRHSEIERRYKENYGSDQDNWPLGMQEHMEEEKSG